MKISKTQFRQLLANMLPLALMRAIRNDHPTLVEGLPDDILREMIEGGLTQARNFGLTQVEDMAGFVLIMFEVGPEFYNHPAIRSILEDGSLRAEQKLEEVLLRTPHKVWDEVVASLHHQRWFPEMRPSGE